MNAALFGGFSKTTPPPGWRRQTALALFGGGDLDLSASSPAGDARLTAIAILGGIDVKVPPGTRVALSGLSLLGGRDVKVAPGDGPTIQVRAFAILGGVTVQSPDAPPAP